MITQLIFFIFAALLIGASLMVVFSRNAVHSALYLIASFMLTAGLWIILQAEFLGLVLIFVYIGAVMTLFLFVVMMLNLNGSIDRTTIVKYWPVVALIVAALLGMSIVVIVASHFDVRFSTPVLQSISDSNVKALGIVLYTRYVLAVEVMAVILLVAIIAAISLNFRGPQGGSKSQNVASQLAANKKQRLKLVDIKVDKQ